MTGVYEGGNPLHLVSRRALAGFAVAVSLMVPALPAQAEEGASLSEELAQDAETLDGSTLYGAFVHFQPGDTADQRQILENSNLEVAGTYPGVDVIYAVGKLARILSLRDDPTVTYLEANRKLQYYGDTAVWATRARVAQSAAAGGPYYDQNGNVLDGSGIGVAVVDSGVDATHPDLSARVAKNYKVVCTTPGLINTRTEQCFGPVAMVEAAQTDSSGGHGTHVAGIVAGDGSASRGTYKGVAPGATLYGFGTGEVISILYAAEAFQYILDNYDSFVPRIRIINNSWGDRAGSSYDPNSIHSKLAAQLTAKGVTLLFAAGNGDQNNNGGTGADDRLSSFAKDPTPGVVTVANYNDAGTGTRNGILSSSSSRGHQGYPENYPDISAPGSSITATCRPTMPVCLLIPSPAWAPDYSILSGTSMATPHVAGVAALLYQARPDLTPAQVEDVLQDTAHKFTFGGPYEDDPQNPGATTSFDKGAGLVDVPAALDALSVAKAGGAPAGTQTSASGDGGDYPGPGAGDIRAVHADPAGDGVTYTVDVRDAAEVGATGSTQFRLVQLIDGVRYTSIVNLTSESAVPAAESATNTAPPSYATRDLEQDSVSFFVPFSKLGDPGDGAVAYNPYLLSYQGLITDMAPGGIGLEVNARPRFGEPFTLIAPVTQVQPAATTVSFTESTATSGQYSDTAVVGALLTDAAGLPLAGRTLAFEMAGSNTNEVLTTVTDTTGVGSVTFTLGGPPETRLLSVSYEGESGVYKPAGTSRDFDVLKEDTITTLDIEGKGSRTTLVARVADEDSGDGVGRRLVEFFADGTSIGLVRTDADGIAMLSPSRIYFAGHHSFRAVFAETIHYLGSSAAASS